MGTPSKQVFNPLTGAGFNLFPQDPAQVVTVAKSGAMFSTIQGAIDSITDASASKQYVVEVAPGVYAENVTSKDYVFIQNGLSGAVKIAGSFIATGLSGVSGIRGVTVEFTGTGNGQVAVTINGGTFYFVDMDVYLLGAANYSLTGVSATSGTAFTVFNSTVWDRRSGTITQNLDGWRFLGAGTFGIFNASTSARAAYSSGNICLFKASNTGSLTVSSGAAIWASSAAFSGEVRGWCCDAVSSSPRIVSGMQIRMTGTSGGTSTGFHINSGGASDIQYINCTLFSTGTTTSNMCDTSANDTQKIFQLSTNKDMARAGTGITIVTPYDLTQTGFNSWGGTGNYWSYNTGTGSFTLLRGGAGIVKSSPVIWAANQNTAALTDKATNYVYMNSSGVIGFTTSPANLYENNIVLFQVWRNGTNYLVCKENHPCDFNNKVSRAWHNIIGALLEESTTVLSSVNTRQIAISGANILNDHGITSTLAAASPATWTIVYTAAGGEMQQYSTATADLPEYYNATGTPTILTPGSNRWVIYRLGVIKDKFQDGTETCQFVALMDSVQNTSGPNATTRINSGLVASFPAELDSLEVVQLGYAVVRKTSAGAIDTSNVPPTTLLQVFGAAFVGGGTATSAALITANTTNFDGELSGADSNLQTIADRLDDYDSLLDWGTGKTYRVGNVVRVTTEGFIGEWRALTAHTAAASFATDVESSYWEIVANSEGSRELVSQSAHGFTFGDEVYHTGTAYAKAQADTAAKAEVVGMVLGVTTNKFVLGKTGKATKAGWGLTAGAAYFLDPSTAGAFTTTEPSVAGQISKPVGIAVSTTAMQLLNMRGVTVGGTNLYTTIGLANNTTTTFHTIQGAAGTGGWLSGTIVIDATTDYVIPFFCFFDRQRDGTTYNVTAQFGDSIPAGLSITNSGSSIQVVMPNNSSFVSASVTYCVQAAANGTTLPVSVSASSVLGSTSGVAPAAGVIGESRRTAASSAVSLVGSSTVTLVEDTLPEGNWLCSVHPAVSVSANGASIYLNVSVDTVIQNEFLVLASSATGRARQTFSHMVTSNGTKKIQARVQATSTVTGTGLDSSAEESYILAVRIG
jgi:hypothetical protein